MRIDYEKLNDAPRMLMETELRPVQGYRFQPTGFADLGPARYTLPDGTEMLLLESAQSVANHMELACWDPAGQDLIGDLRGIPYIKIVDIRERHISNSLLEAHRINSEYVMKDARRVTRTNGVREIAAETFNHDFAREIGYEKDGRVDWKKFYAGLLKYDPNSLIHGCFLEEIAGRLRVMRALSGFIEASQVAVAESGGVKNNIVQPELKGGEGNVPFHRTEFTGKITAFFNLDLALLRGYGFDTNATSLLIALSLFKVRRFLSSGLRLRTACDLQVDGAGLTIVRPKDFVIPDEADLLKECSDLIGQCKNHFAQPAVTEVEWKRKENPVEVTLPQGTSQPSIPNELKEEIEWKKGSAKKQPALKFKKALTPEIAEKAKELFGGNDDVANAIDQMLSKQQLAESDAERVSGNADDEGN